MRQFAWCVQLMLIILLAGCFTKKKVEGIHDFYEEALQEKDDEIKKLSGEIVEKELYKLQFRTELSKQLESAYAVSTDLSTALGEYERCKAEQLRWGHGCMLHVNIAPDAACATDFPMTGDMSYSQTVREVELTKLESAGLIAAEYQSIVRGMKRDCPYAVLYKILVSPFLFWD